MIVRLFMFVHLYKQADILFRNGSLRSVTEGSGKLSINAGAVICPPKIH